MTKQVSVFQLVTTENVKSTNLDSTKTSSKSLLNSVPQAVSKTSYSTELDFDIEAESIPLVTTAT